MCLLDRLDLSLSFSAQICPDGIRWPITQVIFKLGNDMKRHRMDPDRSSCTRRTLCWFCWSAWFDGSWRCQFFSQRFDMVWPPALGCRIGFRSDRLDAWTMRNARRCCSEKSFRTVELGHTGAYWGELKGIREPEAFCAWNKYVVVEFCYTFLTFILPGRTWHSGRISAERSQVAQTVPICGDQSACHSAASPGGVACWRTWELALVTVGAFAGRFPGRAAADHAAAGGLPRLNMTKQKNIRILSYIIVYSL